MTVDMRSRKPADHGEALGFCLQVATTNSALLVRYAAGNAGSSVGLNPLAYSLRMTVEGTLKAAAQHVDTFAEITAQDIGQRLTTEQEAAKAESVRVLGRDLEALA